MDELLSPVSRTYYNRPAGNDAPLLQEVKSQHFSTKAPAKPTLLASSVVDVTEALKNEPDYDTLISALKLLLRDGERLGNFHIGAPGPEAAKLIHILVTEIAPNYWAQLADEDGADRSLFLEALRNLAGLKAILLRLHTLIQQEQQQSNTEAKRPDILLNLGVTLQLLNEVLSGDDTVTRLWTSTSVGADALKRRILAKDLVQLVGGGRLPALPAQAETLLTKTVKATASWSASGVEYSKWLIRNIIDLSRKTEAAEGKKLAADLLSKAMHLGYLDTVVRIIISDLASCSAEDRHLYNIFDLLPHSEQRTLLFGILKELPDTCLNNLDYTDVTRQDTAIQATAGLIKNFVDHQPKNTSHLITWLTNATGAGLGDAIGIRRAVLAVLASNTDNIIAVFEQIMQQYGDELYIRHAAMLQQEVHAQVLLMSAGYLYRLAPVKLALSLKSGGFNQMISKRLAASQTRARLLGMIVGEALSALVDKSDKKLDFKMEETKSEDAMWYKSLVEVSDTPGPLDPLVVSHQLNGETREKTQNPPPQPRLPPKQAVEAPPKPKGIIEVVDSDEEMEDDDIVPLKKPADDAEDSDDDPETIRRDRPKAPVYIRTLITYLRDTENYDRQKLALTTAPTLIRRKANFGTEVKEHADELASLLVGLQDKFDIDDFYNLKIEGMTAIVVAQPQQMAPWFAKTFFNGDYSMGQRASVLTVLGLSARELAGFAPSEYAASASFPSQKLPERMQKMYLDEMPSNKQLYSPSTLKALPPNALDSISNSLTSDWMAPLAANAADAATGPDALKISSFTSRLEAQKSSSVSKAKPRVRAIPNKTAQLIATAFFFPLTARFHAALQSTTGRSRGIVFQPFLLTLYLKTLALLLHAAGPSTLALPDMTTELLTLLLGSSVRAHCVGDLGVTHASLFALLTVLEVNGDRMRDVCREMGREVVEAQEWVVQVLGSTRGEDAGGEEAGVRALAAGCLMKIQEGMEKYRSLLMGDMIG